MFKILISILMVIPAFQNPGVQTCETSAGNENGVISTIVQTAEEVVGDLEPKQLSFSAVDGSRPFTPQPLRPSNVAWTRIKGGWIDIEQLTSR